MSWDGINRIRFIEHNLAALRRDLLPAPPEPLELRVRCFTLDDAAIARRNAERPSGGAEAFRVTFVRARCEV